MTPDWKSPELSSDSSFCGTIIAYDVTATKNSVCEGWNEILNQESPHVSLTFYRHPYRGRVLKLLEHTKFYSVLKQKDET